MPEADLEELGLTIADVDASITILLEQMERSNDDLDESEESVDKGYDPEAAATRTPEGAMGRATRKPPMRPS